VTLATESLTQPNSKTPSLDENLIAEYLACKNDVVYFAAKYCKIEDSTLCQTVDWQPWPYLVELLDTIETSSVNEFDILKARQLGITWTLPDIYALWTALFKKHANIGLFSKGEDEAWELIRKINFTYDALPPFLQKRIEKNRRDYIDFPEMGSRIKAFPSTPNAGSGYTFTLVIRDELDKHPYAEQNFSAVGPAIDAGGKLINLGSRDYMVATESSHLVDRYLKARNNETPAKAIFLGWRLRPVRDIDMTLDEWFEGIKKKYPPYQIEKEYPETEEQALSDAKTIRYFEKEGVDFIRRNCREPVEVKYDGMFRIWKSPEIGARYCAFLDPSDGSDPHAAGWLNVSTGELVAVSHGKCPAEKCAEIFDWGCRFYNNAFNEFELNNSAGKKAGVTLDSLNTPNRRISEVSRDRKNQHGWWTGGSLNSNKNIRTLMLSTLEEAVRNRSLWIYYSAIPAELDSMMKLEDLTIKVPSGKHDDLLMMLGGLLLIRKENKTITAGKYGSTQRAATTYAR
jgi:hypothetical protein